jgi:hypothetical protein
METKEKQDGRGERDSTENVPSVDGRARKERGKQVQHQKEERETAERETGVAGRARE